MDKETMIKLIEESHVNFSKIPKKELKVDFINEILKQNPNCYSQLSLNLKKLVKDSFILENYKLISKHIPRNNDLYIELYRKDQNNYNYFPKKQQRKITVFNSLSFEKILTDKEFDKYIQFFY